jgi:SET domain-containing protein
MRIGIFAIKDIADGEPLSYDYQFDTKEADAFKCYCGSDNCRGISIYFILSLSINIFKSNII